MKTQLLFFNSGSSSTSFYSVPSFLYLILYELSDCTAETDTITFQTSLLCITVPISTDAFLKFTGSPDEQNAQEGGKKARVGIQSSLMRSVILAHFIPT